MIEEGTRLELEGSFVGDSREVLLFLYTLFSYTFVAGIEPRTTTAAARQPPLWWLFVVVKMMLLMPLIVVVRWCLYHLLKETLVLVHDMLTSILDYNCLDYGGTFMH